MTEAQPEGNYYNKYKSLNPITKMIVRGFYRDYAALVNGIAFTNAYEAGCGEGYMTEFLLSLAEGVPPITASDISETVVATASKIWPGIRFEVSSVYNLPHDDASFDLVVACEVLEHLERPEEALVELLRLSREYLLVSVPQEPVWCICNFLRGKYLTRLGNTPGHIQHWSKSAFIEFVARQCDILAYRTPFPWTMLLCRKRKIA